MLYIWTSVWVLRTPNAGPNQLFNVFYKKAEKARKSKKIEAKLDGYLNNLVLFPWTYVFTSENVFFWE